VGTRSKYAIVLFLVLCILTFLFSAGTAGGTGKEPETTLMMVSLFAFMMTVALLVGLRLRHALLGRYPSLYVCRSCRGQLDGAPFCPHCGQKKI